MTSGTLSNLSHKFNEYEAFLGVGDSHQSV